METNAIISDYLLNIVWKKIKNTFQNDKQDLLNAIVRFEYTVFTKISTINLFKTDLSRSKDRLLERSFKKAQKRIKSLHADLQASATFTSGS